MVGVALTPFFRYNILIIMTNIQGISQDNPVQGLLTETGVSVMKMALSNQKQEAQDLMKMIDSVQFFTDPALGNQVNILA